MKALSKLTMVLLGVVACGCSSIQVSYDYDADANFESYRTFEWAQASGAGGDEGPTVPVNSLIDRRIRRAIEEQLAARGLQRSDEGPDVQVAYYIAVEDKINVTDWGYSYGDAYWGWGGREIDVYQYKEGTLVVDLAETERGLLVWRGAAKGTIDENTSQEKMDRNIQQTMSRIFENYPPEAR